MPSAQAEDRAAQAEDSENKASDEDPPEHDTGAPGDVTDEETQWSSGSKASSKLQCQAVGCSANLAAEGKYCMKRRLCREHLKAKSVLHKRGGSEPWRFCQQCGKLEPLSYFDGSKRSCRVQLERRRLTANTFKRTRGSGSGSAGNSRAGPACQHHHGALPPAVYDAQDNNQVAVWLQQLQDLKAKQQELEVLMQLHQHQRPLHQHRHWQPDGGDDQQGLATFDAAGGHDVWALQPGGFLAGAADAQLQLLAAGAAGIHMQGSGSGASHALDMMLAKATCSAPEQLQLAAPGPWPALAVGTVNDPQHLPQGSSMGRYAARTGVPAAAGQHAIFGAEAGANLAPAMLSGGAPALGIVGQGSGQYLTAPQQQQQQQQHQLCVLHDAPTAGAHATQGGAHHTANQQQQQQQLLNPAPGCVAAGSILEHAAGSTMQPCTGNHAVHSVPHLAGAGRCSTANSSENASAAAVAACKPHHWPLTGPLLELLLQRSTTSSPTGALAAAAAAAAAMQETREGVGAAVSHSAAHAAVGTAVVTTTAAAAAAAEQDAEAVANMDFDSFVQVLEMLPAASLGMDSNELASVIKAALAEAQANQLQQQQQQQQCSQDGEQEQREKDGQQQLVAQGSGVTTTSSALVSPFAAASQQSASAFASVAAGYDEASDHVLVKEEVSSRSAADSAAAATAAAAAGRGTPTPAKGGAAPSPFAGAAAEAMPTAMQHSLLRTATGRQPTWDRYGALLASLPGPQTCESLMSITPCFSALDNIAEQLEAALMEVAGDASGQLPA